MAHVLEVQGLPDMQATALSHLFKTLAQQFRGTKREQFIHTFFVPGRIEVLGKHTDYCGGQSLIGAVPFGFCFMAQPSNQPQLDLVDGVSGEVVSFPLAAGIEPWTGHWANYPMTVARRVARNFPGALNGGRIVFQSTLPSAAGLSSSSAFMIGVFLCLRAFNNLEEHPVYQQHINSQEDLAHYLGVVENGQSFGALVGDRGVGTFGGSQDHTAILCSQPKHLSLYAYAPTRLVQVLPWPQEFVFVIGSSGVLAQKTGSARRKYNQASQRASQVVSQWNHATGRTDPHLAAVISAPDFSIDRLKSIVSDDARANALWERFRQFYTEQTQVIPKAVQSLSSKDWVALGEAVSQSQAAAEYLLHNQVPETIYLARQARDLGAIAASAFGAGFGGSVWAMVKHTEAHHFMKSWRSLYTEAFAGPAKRSTFFTVQPGPPAFEICV